MSQPHSPLAYANKLREIMDKALELPQGLELEVPTWAAAYALRQRLYGARRAEKRGVAKSSHVPESMVNLPWDTLTIRVEPVDPSKSGRYDPHKLVVQSADAALDGVVIRDPTTGEPIL